MEVMGVGFWIEDLGLWVLGLGSMWGDLEGHLKCE